MNCTDCKEHQRETAPVPYTVHEGDMARAERSNKRLWIIVILLILVLIATNAAWIYYENQFEDVTTTVEQESETGYNNYIGNDGDILNGQASSDDPEACP